MKRYFKVTPYGYSAASELVRLAKHASIKDRVRAVPQQFVSTNARQHTLRQSCQSLDPVTQHLIPFFLQYSRVRQFRDGFCTILSCQHCLKQRTGTMRIDIIHLSLGCRVPSLAGPLFASVCKAPNNAGYVIIDKITGIYNPIEGSGLEPTDCSPIKKS